MNTQPDKVTFHNVWTSATFTVVGKDAIERMHALTSWGRTRLHAEREPSEATARERLFVQ